MKYATLGVRYDEETHDWIIVVESRPNKIQRLFGMKPERTKYLGDCTVWHKKSGERASTFKEEMLNRIWHRAKYEDKW